MGKKELSDTPLTDAVLDHIRRMQDNMSYGDLLMIQHAERMERDRAKLLESVRAVEQWADHQGAWKLRDILRVATAKTTGDSHE